MLERLSALPRLEIMEPLGYLDFLCLTAHAKLVLTDSGGLQEETTVLGVPCLTLRACTERPVTVTIGTNIVVGCNAEQIRRAVTDILAGRGKRGSTPELWDGHASERIARILIENISGDPFAKAER
jgi:UDP-N-acetylglucosamine 2-epimerase (non-hydrolysing)